MALSIFEAQGLSIAEVLTDQIIIHSTQDALDLMANAQYQGASHMILYEHTITPEFFDLKTGLAGEILQKYSNYQMTLAIVGDFDKFASKSLKAFIVESNRGQQIAFVASKQAAIDHFGLHG